MTWTLVTLTCPHTGPSYSDRHVTWPLCARSTSTIGPAGYVCAGGSVEERRGLLAPVGLLGKAHRDKGQCPTLPHMHGLGEPGFGLPQDTLVFQMDAGDPTLPALHTPAGAAGCPRVPRGELTGAFGDGVRPDGAQKLPAVWTAALLISQSRVSCPDTRVVPAFRKTKKLIAVNDRARRVWPELQARMHAPSSKALPQPRTSPRRGAKPCTPQSRGLVFV